MKNPDKFAHYQRIFHAILDDEATLEEQAEFEEAMRRCADSRCFFEWEQELFEIVRDKLQRKTAPDKLCQLVGGIIPVNSSEAV